MLIEVTHHDDDGTVYLSYRTWKFWFNSHDATLRFHSFESYRRSTNDAEFALVPTESGLPIPNQVAAEAICNFGKKVKIREVCHYLNRHLRRWTFSLEGVEIIGYVQINNRVDPPMWEARIDGADGGKITRAQWVHTTGAGDTADEAISSVIKLFLASDRDVANVLNTLVEPPV